MGVFRVLPTLLRTRPLKAQGHPGGGTRGRGQRQVLRPRPRASQWENLLRNYLRSEKQKLNQGPRGGRRFWFVLFAGCFVAFVGGYFFITSPEDQLERFFAAGQVGAGTGMALTAVAELLPQDRVKLTSALRKLSLAIMAVAIVGATAVFFT